jgi:hypothetical protein
MIVVCCGNRRSGSTLQYQIAAYLALSQGSNDIKGYGVHKRLDLIARLASADGAVVVVKEHDFSEHLLSLKDPRFIYSYRDVRDAIVSLYQKGGNESPSDDRLDGDWGRKTRENLETMLSNDESWRKVPGILISRYEELKADIGGEVRRIAQHVGIEVTDAWVSGIVSRLSMERQEEYIRSFDFDTKGKGIEVDRYDPGTQLHKKHLNGGETGKWRRSLSPERIEFIESIAGEWLVRNGYPLAKDLPRAAERAPA